MALHLYTSNKLEALADKLADAVAVPLPSPMTPEVIVVQSPGMAQWISLQLARRFGVWSNCRYPFPNTILQELFATVSPDSDEGRLFEREVLTWRIMNLLPECLAQQEFTSLKNYLGDESGFLKTWQLARQIAHTFDQYVIYRPDMIFGWEQVKGKGWQPQLWRLLTREGTALHRAALREILFKKLRDNADAYSEILLPRISIFGISALPPFHMEVFARVAEFIEVNLFLMNPSQEYWADIKSDYEILKTQRRAEAEKMAPRDEDLHLEKGNSLLASMGRLGRDFQESVMEQDPVFHEMFENPPAKSLLHWLQYDILHMIDRGASAEEGSGKILFAEEQMRADHSVCINSCHSPLREVEVLYDYLLELFNGDPELEPRDILVMTPDIETYAPFIRAVFNKSEKNNRFIPFNIADRTIKNESRLARTFLAVIDCAGSRFNTGRVLDLLECEDIQRRFSLLGDDVEFIRKWIKDTRICWGIDAEHRTEQEVPGFKENTWKAGIERLLLGYAMAGHGEQIFHDILPYDNIEGATAAVMGRFLEFVEKLFNAARALEEHLTLSQWLEKLFAVLEDLFLPDEETERDAKKIRNVISHLPEIEQLAGFSNKIDLDVIRAWLEHALREETAGSSFLTGRVTFCAMLPMRSIPFKILCLIGMNDKDFPRKTTAVGFNIIAQKPRRGDRSQRNDDRYLFLEALISARDRLYISYTGQGIQDNSEMPPSVLVSELLDYIEQGFEVLGKKIRDYILVKQRLQAFSASYFEKKGKLFSYSMENYQGCRAALRERRAPMPFIDKALPLPEEQAPELLLQEITAFFTNPAKYLLTKRLKLYLEEADVTIEEREPFTFEGLEKYQLQQMMCERQLSRKDTAILQTIARASGVLPHGRAGDFYFMDMVPEVLRFVQQVQEFLKGRKPALIEILLNLNGLTISGRINNIWGDELIHYRCAAIKARDRMRIWIEHLAVNACVDDAHGKRSVLIGSDSVCLLKPIKPHIARTILATLVSIYEEGQCRPIHFYPESSFAYMEAVHNGKSEKALQKAKDKWESSDYSYGESDDPYFKLCFGSIQALDEEFKQLSEAVYKPFIEYQEQT